ncbi:terminase small subunit [Enterobacter cloacae complex sp. IR5450]|uniref:terminase small subunit n=1 Tax=Enterobacter cloacae complex sp. IR5450 TaxID=3412372 RepID=UPI003BA4E4AB
MAKPDWGELQQRFLSEHAATGVSPKEWCEAQGLNYATARRYIKKTSAQKPAQKKMRTAQKDKSANELVDDDGLTAQQCLFVAEYLKDNNATAAAARAGYSDPNYGRQLITNPNVAQAIAHQQKASIARTLGGADEVLAQIWQLATFDANQLSQYRRGACRYCWGFGHQYQWRDMVEFEEKRLEALERKSREPADVGGYGYDHNREPNPACRSTETLIIKSWRELGIDIDEMDEGTRASMDGQVPAKTTYLEWLARQPAQRQDQVLGAERGRLFRAGEIDLADMFTDKGEWISLERLKQLSGP